MSVNMIQQSRQEVLDRLAEIQEVVQAELNVVRATHGDSVIDVPVLEEELEDVNACILIVAHMAEEQWVENLELTRLSTTCGHLYEYLCLILRNEIIYFVTPPPTAHEEVVPAKPKDKHLEEINLMFDKAIDNVCMLMEEGNFSEEQKSELMKSFELITDQYYLWVKRTNHFDVEVLANWWFKGKAEKFGDKTNL